MSAIKKTDYVMTPKEAEDILKNHNPRNRAINDRRVAKYVQIILDGKWQNDGNSICFDLNGNLINGQHRLSACVRAKKSIVVDLRYGLPFDAILTIDTGRSRSPGDILGILGYTDPHNTNSTVGIINAFNNNLQNQHSKSWTTTAAEAVEIMENGLPPGDVHESLLRVYACRKIITPSVAAAMHYLFAKKDRVLADSFFAFLATGESLNGGDPILAIRERFTYMRMQKLSKKIGYDRKEYVFYLITAWNRVRTGKKLNSLRVWNATDVLPEIK